ncbi:cell division protein FtsA [Streptococcus constellatus subsp. pharyngis]|uniref:Cell division protein FtsA n=1 Tax=Streptococcus constellatus subsp. pharyngis SK1060 = CCUG 46377 TaxID=1035184 RepID=U2YAV9_STRCV|nr:cell division protein FtsA [Streptococcus constellatus]AGU72327.1 cell division protein FtsA [Streptococcus constellatus subsp. pharyngis C232]AGU74083.1 cell division protein FtsA [Streptococcus constellatus subsp. pharyngis C818]AGU79451.1 cell division protein FtsA [Streptococcus constellatus subsp. pharyngis C1050]QRP81775.1 cell division protein FtsA [Streptococcus constellatus]GAD44190.1 actin-like ATPase [Streptococcus constellatus subsp. pharyngis SK1060 = CCUG 46377]
MARDGFFTGLDIGTSSIKVLVAEHVNNELNVIGVSNAKSAGVKDGIIVDIEAAASAIKSAISQAEEKAGISIKLVNVGLPANLLQIEATQGMIPVTSETKEITDADVENVVRSALTKSMTPDREVITFIPEEFIVDGFQGIRDPRGMMGIRLEMRGLLYTGPRTILHNLRKTVERAGVQVENIIISPLAMTKSVLNEGEREFGATVIDMGGGQTTAASVRNQELQFTNIYQEGGEYVTKDISKVLKTSKKLAESLKFNYGEAYVPAASNESFQVEVIGEVEPVEVTERYLAEIISARVKHIFEQIKQDLERRHLLELPGGIVIIGGGAILPGVVELAQEVFGVPVKLYVPNQIGIRNPAFAHVISLSEYAGNLSEVDVLAQAAVHGDELLRHQPVEFSRPTQQTQSFNPLQRFTQPQQTTVTPIAEAAEEVERPEPLPTQSQQPKEKLTDRVRNLLGNMFD